MRNKKICFLLITIIFLVILNFFPKPKEVLKEEEKSTKTEKLISMNLEQTAGAIEPDFKTIEKIANICGYEINFINKELDMTLNSKNIERNEL